MYDRNKIDSMHERSLESAKVEPRVMLSGKQTTARKMADQLKNCINQGAHGFYSNRIHIAGSVWITDTITNVMIHYNTSPQKCCAWQEIKVQDNCWNPRNDQKFKKRTKLLEALFSVIKARLNGFSPLLQSVSVVA